MLIDPCGWHVYRGYIPAALSLVCADGRENGGCLGRFNFSHCSRLWLSMPERVLLSASYILMYVKMAKSTHWYVCTNSQSPAIRAQSHICHRAYIP